MVGPPGHPGGAIQLEKWCIRLVPWQSHAGDVYHCDTHYTHMSAAGTKRTLPEPRRNKKETDGASSTHVDLLEKVVVWLEKNGSVVFKRPSSKT